MQSEPSGEVEEKAPVFARIPEGWKNAADPLHAAMAIHKRSVLLHVGRGWQDPVRQRHGRILIRAREYEKAYLFGYRVGLLFPHEVHQIVSHNPQDVDLPTQRLLHDIRGSAESKKGCTERIGILVGLDEEFI